MTDKFELVDRYFDESLTADESAELAQWLQDDPGNARYFAERAELHAGLWRSLRRQSETKTNAVREEDTPHLREPESRLRLPSWTYLVALAACVLIVLGLWRFWPTSPKPRVADEDSRQQEKADDSVEPPIPDVQLAGHWQITPTGNAAFHVIAPTLVRLDRGELLVESTGESPEKQNDPQGSLHIETPHGEAVATGTKFYVGTHKPTEKEGSTMVNPLTRVLVLSGAVTLTTALGSVEGGPGELLAVEPDKAPTKIAVQANSDFAFDLYQQLSKENEGKNLFFSPYSVSGALAMTAEGARHETAVEMGTVLRFPDAAKRIGGDAQRIPWETSLIHTGMADLNRKLNGGSDERAEAASVRKKTAEVRDQLEAAKHRTARLRKERKWREANESARAERPIVAELNELLSQVDQYEIRVANALWGEKTYPFDPEYVKTISEHYETGGIFPVDFRNAFEEARLRINGWVEGETNNRIKDLIPTGGLNEYTRLVLTNAIYFKGDWSVPFKEENTKDRDFTLSGGDKAPTAIMHAPKLNVARYGAFNADGSHFDTPMRIRHGQKKVARYPKADGFAMIELPYKGDDLSMVVIAPNDPAGLPAIEKELTPENLNQWIAQLKKRDTHVYLPKFKMETEYTLGDAESPGTLQRMGMVRAFVDPRDPKKGAQFYGMTTSTNPMEQLYIWKVFHKAFIDVNEKGTEAAAATAVVMAVPLSAPADFPFIPEFKADRPFVYLIREKSTGSILFLGRVNDPTAG